MVIYRRVHGTREHVQFNWHTLILTLYMMITDISLQLEMSLCKRKNPFSVRIHPNIYITRSSHIRIRVHQIISLSLQQTTFQTILLKHIKHILHNLVHLPISLSNPLTHHIPSQHHLLRHIRTSTLHEFHTLKAHTRQSLLTHKRKKSLPIFHNGNGTFIIYTEVNK